MFNDDDFDYGFWFGIATFAAAVINGVIALQENSRNRRRERFDYLDAEMHHYKDEVRYLREDNHFLREDNLKLRATLNAEIPISVDEDQFNQILRINRNA